MENKVNLETAIALYMDGKLDEETYKNFLKTCMKRNANNVPKEDFAISTTIDMIKDEIRKFEVEEKAKDPVYNDPDGPMGFGTR